MITVQDLGGPTTVARIVKLAVPTVHGWKRIPENHCAAIELAKKGLATAEEMRPDVPWSRIPDPNWPHPMGRPVVDVARTVAAATPCAQAEAARH